MKKSFLVNILVFVVLALLISFLSPESAESQQVRTLPRMVPPTISNTQTAQATRVKRLDVKENEEEKTIDKEEQNDNELEKFSKSATKDGKKAEKSSLKKKKEKDKLEETDEEGTEEEKTAEEIYQKLSKIERLYFGKTDEILYQYGYDTFKEQLRSLSLESSDRQLVPGDNLILNLYGDAVDILVANNANIVQTAALVIDRNGFVDIPGIGSVFLTGLTVSDARYELEQLFNAKYAGIEVDLRIEQAGSIPIYVLGEVNNPGTVMVASNSTIIEAITRAGGVKKTGSLREIVVNTKYNKKKDTVDLYNFLKTGRVENKPFSPGDVVIIRPINNVIAISGAVINPAIYEFKKGEDLYTLLQVAGGPSPNANLNRIHVESYSSEINNKKATDLTLQETKTVVPDDGDLVTFYGLPDEVVNMVTLSGNVKNKGSYQLKENMKLSELLDDKKKLLPDTYEDYVAINREIGYGRLPETINVPLKEVLEGKVDIDLYPNDEVVLFQSQQSPRIKVHGAVKNPGLVVLEPKMTLMDVIGKVGLTYPSEYIVAEISNFEEDEETGEMIKTVHSVYLYDTLLQNYEDNAYNIRENDSIFFRKIKPTEKLKSITIIGQVANPGVISLRPGMSFIEGLNKVGGLRNDAYLKGMIFARRRIGYAQDKIIEVLAQRLEADMLENGIRLAALEEQVATSSIEQINETQQKLIENLKERNKQQYGRLVLDDEFDTMDQVYNLELKDGDVIYIPEKVNYIIIAGEVFNQAGVLYSAQKKVKDYIQAVGGMTTKADKKNSYISKVNGTIISIRQDKKKFYNSTLDPGDAIIIPSKIEAPRDYVRLVTDITRILAQTSQTVFLFTQLSD